MGDSVSFDILFKTSSAEADLKKFATTVDAIIGGVEKKFSKLDTVTTRLVKNMRVLGNNKFTGFNKGLQSANKQMSMLEKKMRRLNSMSGGAGGGGGKSTGGGNRFVSGAMGLVGGMGAHMLGAELKDMFMVGVDFEYSMKRIQIILGETDESFSSLKGTIADVAANTSFTLSDVGLSTTVLAKAGWELEKIQKSLINITNLGISSGTTPEVAADLVSSASNIWGIESDFEGITDIMTATSNKFKADMAGLKTYYQYAGALQSKGGMSFLDSNVLFGVLKDKGYADSKIGTAARTFSSEMLAPKPKTLEIMKKYGQSFTEVVDGVEKVKDLEDLLPMLDKWTDSEMRSGFGKVAFAQISDLVDSYSDGIFTTAKNEIIELRGVTEAQAEGMLETTRGSLDLLGSAWSALSVRVFDSLKGKDGVIDSITGVISYMAGIETDDEIEKLNRVQTGWTKIGDAIGYASEKLVDYWTFVAENSNIVRFVKDAKSAAGWVNEKLSEDLNPKEKPKYTEEEKKYWTMRNDADPSWKPVGSSNDLDALSGMLTGDGTMKDGVYQFGSEHNNLKALEKILNPTIKTLEDIGEKDAKVKGDKDKDNKTGEGDADGTLTSPLTSVANQMSRSVVVNMDALMNVENQYIGTSGGELSTEDIQSQLAEALIHVVRDYELGMSN